MAKRTKEHCEKVARTCTTINEFWSTCRSAATKAQQEGWIDSYTWLTRERVKRNSLDEEECRRIAKKYKTIRDFRTKAPSAYVTANRHGWLQSFTWLEREVGVKHYRTKDDIVKVARKFKTMKDFREQYPNECRYAWAHGWLEECTWLKRERPGRKQVTWKKNGQNGRIWRAISYPAKFPLRFRMTGTSMKRNTG